MEHCYLCKTCALKNGAVWPEGHVATFQLGICELCSEERALAHTSDWNWPIENKHLQQDREI